MNYIKKHKKETITIAIVVFVLILLLAVVHAILPDKSKSSWGNRLNDIKEHPISDTVIADVKKVLTDTKKVDSVTYRLNGRTMNFIISMSKDVSRADAEKVVPKILDKLDSNISGYYDIEVYITSSSSDEYPFMAHKHRNNSEFKFTYVG